MSSAFQMSSVLFKCHFLTYKKQKTYMTNKKHRFFLSFLLFFLGIMYICKIYVYTKILAKSILSNLCTKIISLTNPAVFFFLFLAQVGGQFHDICRWSLESMLVIMLFGIGFTR